MKDYGHILSKVTSTPWMMMPSSLKMMLEILEAHLSGNITQEEIRQRLQSVTPKDNGASRSASVGVLPLHGPIFPKANMMTEMSGATSLDQWSKQFMEMVEDDSISAIVMDVDSPGGLADMIPETAEMIREARDVKPIYAVANTMAASAAYGLASQATKLYGSPSSITGSVGTYMVHTDESQLMEKIGVKETVIKAGRFKAVELESLTPESKQYLEDFVGDVNEKFIEAIADGRGVHPSTVREQYGDGRIFQADRALEAGAIDGIATLSEVVAATLVDGGGGLTHSFPGRKQSYEADMEHSEPGSGLGGEPTPREPPEEGDLAIEGGWRRDPPPIAYEETEEAVNSEWLHQQADTLGLIYEEDTPDEVLAPIVAERINEVIVPLREATVEATKQQEFASLYPEQADRLARLEQRDREAEARQFADSYASFEGMSRGYSPLVREKIEESHQKIALRQFTHTDLQELLDLTAKKESTVPLDEKGSSRTRETVTVAPSQDFREARQQFADAVQLAMTEDNLSQEAAMQHVAQQNPELAHAYLIGHVGR